MSVFTRLSDIVNANINVLLEQAEDPEKLVLLMVQEMEETLVAVRSTSARQIAAKKDIEQRLQYFAGQSEAWEAKAELAIRKGRDDLARGALAEKASAAQMAEHLEADLAAVDANLAKLKQDTCQLEAKLREVKVRQNALIMRGETASTRLRIRRQLADTGYNDAIERFGDYERRLDEMEGSIESYDLGQHTLAQQIEALESDERIDQELESLKQRVKGAAAKPADNAASTASGGE